LLVVGGSSSEAALLQTKEQPNDFDGWYSDFGLDPDTLDLLFVEKINDQQIAFGGRLFDLPSYEGFFQTDRSGRPKGAIALDPKEFITS
jgi:hypothetical protein